jgi:hypothetical protein
MGLRHHAIPWAYAYTSSVGSIRYGQDTPEHKRENIKTIQGIHGLKKAVDIESFLHS